MHEQDQAKRRHIARAALQVFSEHGFSGATLKQIAQAANISPGLVYWYFKDKDDLFREAVTTVAEEILLPPLQNATDAVPIADVLRGFAVRYFTTMQQVNGTSFLLIGDILRLDASSLPFLEAGPVRGVRAMAGLFQRRQQTGELAPFDPLFGAELFLGMLLSQVVARRMLPETPLTDPETAAHAVVQMFLDGARQTVPHAALRSSRHGSEGV